MREDPLFTVSGRRLPKKSAADVGQKESAKTKPSRPAPHTPSLSACACIFCPQPEPEPEGSASNSRRNMPTRISSGPMSMFMYFWRKWES